MSKQKGNQRRARSTDQDGLTAGGNVLTPGGGVGQLNDGVRNWLSTNLGRRITARDITNLAGLPANANVRVSLRGGRLVIEGRRGRGGSGSVRRVIYRDRNGKVVMRNVAIRVARGTPTRAALVQFASQISAARRIGINSIIIEATQMGKGGHMTWPSLGFNARLPRWATPPPSLGKPRTILDLFSTPAGRAWWARNGRNTDMEFDLSTGSRSSATFRSYMRARGIRNP